MKTLITILGIVCIASAAQAKGKSDHTLEEFLVASKAQADEKGWKWNKEKQTERFGQMDANGDGIATAKERKEWHANKKKGQ